MFDHKTLTAEYEKLEEFERNFENSEEQKVEQPEMTKDDDYFDLEDYRYENDRHRIITAMIISDLFIYMLKHFKANCIN